MTIIQSLGNILTSIDNISWEHALYLAGEYPWNADTVAAVLDDTEIEDVEKPVFIESYELNWVLDIQTVQDIVHGAKKQIAEPDVQSLIDSFNYYWKYDAFLRLT